MQNSSQGIKSTWASVKVFWLFVLAAGNPVLYSAPDPSNCCWGPKCTHLCWAEQRILRTKQTQNHVNTLAHAKIKTQKVKGVKGPETSSPQYSVLPLAQQKKKKITIYCNGLLILHISPVVLKVEELCFSVDSIMPGTVADILLDQRMHEWKQTKIPNMFKKKKASLVC